MLNIHVEYEEDVHKDCALFLDQASQLGYSVWSDETKELIESGSIIREDRDMLDYGVYMQEWLSEMVEKYPIKVIFYEEVFVSRTSNPGSVEVTEKLYYMKHKVQEFGHQKRIRTLGLDNGRWKKFLSDKKTFRPKRGVSDKDEVKRLVKLHLPDYEPSTEDETDALGMGIAVMVNGGGDYLDVARFNKRLGIHWGVAGTDWEGFKEEGKLYARYNHARNVGGIQEIPLQSGKLMDDYFRKVLTHDDVLAFTVVTPDYTNWGMYLLLNDVNPKELTLAEEKLYLDETGKFMNEHEEGTYILFASRRQRL